VERWEGDCSFFHTLDRFVKNTNFCSIIKQGILVVKTERFFWQEIIVICNFCLLNYILAERTGAIMMVLVNYNLDHRYNIQKYKNILPKGLKK